MRVLAIDPSINNVGFAIWDSTKKDRYKAWRWGCWRLQGYNYQMKLMDLIEHIDTEIEDFDILVTEWPAFYTSDKGKIAAHQNYTIDLAGICYFIAGWYRRNHRQHFPLTASMWKGSVPKLVTQRKFIRTFGKIAHQINEHAVDATMMLHYWLITYGEKIHKANAVEFKPQLI